MNFTKPSIPSITNHQSHRLQTIPIIPIAPRPHKMPNTRPFPIVKGGCGCGQIRYQLEAAPLFCYACHCSECQKSSGSIFASSATIEFDRVRCISTTQPKIITIAANRHERTIATCPNCHDVLWDCGSYAPSTYNVHIGTLDLPGLFEPDLHIYIEAKVNWLTLPEGTRTQRGDMDRTKVWPKSSLARFEACMRRWDALQQSEKEAERKEQADEVESGQEEKTPTNGSPEPKGEEDEDDEDEEEEEDDEAYAKRTDAIEKELQERLAQLTLKLTSQEKSQS
jgi:hypothetical protein